MVLKPPQRLERATLSLVALLEPVALPTSGLGPVGL